MIAHQSRQYYSEPNKSLIIRRCLVEEWMYNMLYLENISLCRIIATITLQFMIFSKGTRHIFETQIQNVILSTNFFSVDNNTSFTECISFLSSMKI